MKARSGLYLFAVSLAMGGVSTGCRFFKSSRSAPMSVETREPDLPEGYTSELGAEAKASLCEVLMVHRKTSQVFLGKQMVRVAPSIPAESPKKVGNHLWVTGETAQSLIEDMKRAVAAHRDPKSSPMENRGTLKFMKCEGNAARTLPETQDPKECDYLFDSTDPNMAPQFEFLIMYSPEGTLHQWIRVSTDIFQRPALFMTTTPLTEYVLVNFRPDSHQNHVVVTPPLPTGPFSPSVKTYVEEKLVGKIFGFIGNDVPAFDLAGFSQKWEKQQFDKASLVVLQVGAEVGLVVATGGTAALGLAWRQAMTAAGKAIAQKTISKAATLALAKAFLQTAVLTGQFYWILRLDRLAQSQYEGPLKDILWFGSLIAYASMYYNIGELGNRFAAGLIGAVANGGMMAINKGFRLAVQEVMKKNGRKPLSDNFSLNEFFQAFPDLGNHYYRIMGQFQKNARASVAALPSGALTPASGNSLMDKVEELIQKSIKEFGPLVAASASSMLHYREALRSRMAPQFEDRMCDNMVKP